MNRLRRTVAILIALTLMTGCQTEKPLPEPVVELTSTNPTVSELKVNTLQEIGSSEKIIDTANTNTEQKVHLQEFVSEELNFIAQIPADWQTEYIADIQAVNIFDPNASDDTTLEKSQIFVRTFTASEFLTLQTVTIHSQTQITINDRPAVVYDIEKKPGVANFASQPSWRSQRHVVTDIRSTNDSPTTFYVFGKRPDLDQTVFDTVINSLEFK